MSLKTWLAKIFNWLKRVVRAADEAIEDLSPELKKAFEIGSGVVNILNTTFGQSPEYVKEALYQIFPNLTEDDIVIVLNKISAGLNIGSDISDSLNLDELIEKIQAQLQNIKGFDGSVWAKTSSFLSKLIAQLYAPEGTKSSIFELLMETFYQTRVKN